MTVKELREILAQYPDDMVVYVDFDPEGGHEGVVDDIEPIMPSGKAAGIKLI